MPAEDIAIEHEAAFVNAFIDRKRRERYRAMLASRKKRGAFLDRLNHRFTDDLDDRYVCASPTLTIPAADKLCYIIASEDQYDGKVVSVSEATEILRAAHFGVVISYLPGSLAAYRDEAPADVIWMERS